MMYIFNTFDEIENAFCAAVNSDKKIHQICYFPQSKDSAQRAKEIITNLINAQQGCQFKEADAREIPQDVIFLIDSIRGLIKSVSIIEGNIQFTYAIIINYFDAEQKPELIDMLEKTFPGTKITLIYIYKPLENEAALIAYKANALNKILKSLSDNSNRSWIIVSNFLPLIDTKESNANRAVVAAAIGANAMPQISVTPNPSDLKTFINSLNTKSYVIGVPTAINYNKPDGTIANENFTPIGFGSPASFNSQAFFNAITSASGYSTAATPNDVITIISNARPAAPVPNKYSDIDFTNLINILRAWINANTAGPKASDIRDFINKLTLLSYATGVPTSIPYTANVLRNITRTFTPIGSPGPAAFNAIDFFNTVKNKPAYASATTTSDIISLFSALQNTPGKYAAADGTNIANVLTQWVSSNGAGATVANIKNYINTISNLSYTVGQSANVSYSLEVSQPVSKSFTSTGSPGPIIFDKGAFFNAVTSNAAYINATKTSDIINLFNGLVNTPSKYAQSDGAAMATLLNQWVSNNGAGATVANMKNYINIISALNYTVGSPTNWNYLRNTSQLISSSFTPIGYQGPTTFDQAAFLNGFINSPSAQSSAASMQNYFNNLGTSPGKYSAQDGINMGSIIQTLCINGGLPANQFFTYLSQFFGTLSIGTNTNLVAAAGFSGVVNFSPIGCANASGKVIFDQAAFFSQFQSNYNQINTLPGVLNCFNNLSDTPGQYSAQDGTNMVTAINMMNGLIGLNNTLSVLTFFCGTMSINATTSLTNSQYYTSTFRPVGCADASGKVVFDQAAFFANFMKSNVYNNPTPTVTQIKQFFNNLTDAPGQYSAADGAAMANAITAYASVSSVPDANGFIVINTLKQFSYTLSINAQTNITGKQGPFSPIGSSIAPVFSSNDFFNAVINNPTYASAKKMSIIINLFKNLPNIQLKYSAVDGVAVANLLTTWAKNNGTAANVATMKAYINSLAGLSYTAGTAVTSSYVINSSQSIIRSLTPTGSADTAAFDQAAFFSPLFNRSYSSTQDIINYYNNLTPIIGKYSRTDGANMASAIQQMTTIGANLPQILNALSYFNFTLSAGTATNLFNSITAVTGQYVNFTPQGFADASGKVRFDQAAFFSNFLNSGIQSSDAQLQSMFRSLPNTPGKYSNADGVAMANIITTINNIPVINLYYNISFAARTLSVGTQTNMLAAYSQNGTANFTPTGFADASGKIRFDQAAFFNAFFSQTNSGASVVSMQNIFSNLSDTPGKYSNTDGVNMANTIGAISATGASVWNVLQSFNFVLSPGISKNLLGNISFTPVGSAPILFSSMDFFNSVDYSSATTTSEIIDLFNSITSTPGQYAQADGAAMATILTQWAADNRDQATVANMKNYIDMISMLTYTAGSSVPVNYNIIPVPSSVETSFTPTGAAGVNVFDKDAFFGAVTNNNGYSAAVNTSAIIALFNNLTNSTGKYSQTDGTGMGAALAQWVSNNGARATVSNLKGYINTISALSYTAGGSTDIGYNIITLRGVSASFTPQGQPGIAFKSQDFFAAAMTSNEYTSSTATILSVINSFGSLIAAAGKYSQADGVTMKNMLLEWHSYNPGNSVINIKAYISGISRLTYSAGNPTDISYVITVPTAMSTVFTATGAPGPAIFVGSDLISAVTANPLYASATVQSIIAMFKALPDTINKYAHADGTNIGALLERWFNDLTYTLPNAWSVKQAAVSALTPSNSQAFRDGLVPLDPKSIYTNTTQTMLNAIQALANQAAYPDPAKIAQAFQNTRNIVVKVIDGSNSEINIQNLRDPYAIMVNNFNISSLIVDSNAKASEQPNASAYLYYGYVHIINNPRDRVYGIYKSS